MQRHKLRNRIKWHHVLIATIGFLLMWIVTANWGVADVTRYCLKYSKELMPPESQRLTWDPHNRPPGWRETLTADQQEYDPERPWYYVGNASSPFPCIIGIDLSQHVGFLAGEGSRYYFFWCFGLKFPIHASFIWMS